MPRSARKKGESGVYHVIIQGGARQLLFEDDEDRCFFLNRMDVVASDSRVSVYAYALMPNHVHLLVKDAEDRLDSFMRRIGSSYVAYFNKKYERTGQLFQDRFKSEPVDTDEYLLTVYRYILRNPEKAGIAPADGYVWSSYSDYLQDAQHSDPCLLRDMIGDADAFRYFMNAVDDRLCMEFEPVRKDDAAAAWLIRKLIGSDNLCSLQSFDKNTRDDILRKLKKQGFSCRQIERLTGIGRGIVQKA